MVVPRLANGEFGAPENLLTYLPATGSSYRSSAGIVKNGTGFGGDSIQASDSGEQRGWTGRI